MAYISQEKKKELAVGIKKVLKKYGMKGTVGVNHHSSLVVNLWEGALDLLGDAQKHNDKVAQQRGQESYSIGDYLQVNTYRADEWAFSETIANFYKELIAAMKGTEWYNKSDIMTDYFDIAYYLDVNVGKWDKGYVYNA
jgi:hypothetical protein